MQIVKSTGPKIDPWNYLKRNPQAIKHAHQILGLNFCVFSKISFSSTVQQSKNSKNFYFDIRLQTEKDKTKYVRVMVQRGKSSKRKFFSG